MLQRFEQRKNPKIPERQATLKLRLRLLTARRPFNTNILAGTQLAIKFRKKSGYCGCTKKERDRGKWPKCGNVGGAMPTRTSSSLKFSGPIYEYTFIQRRIHVKDDN